MEKQSVFSHDPKQWLNQLEAANEHAAFAWHALGVTSNLENSWPPVVTGRAKVGSLTYHLAALIGYVNKVFNGIAETLPDEEG